MCKNVVAPTGLVVLVVDEAECEGEGGEGEATKRQTHAEAAKQDQFSFLADRTAFLTLGSEPRWSQLRSMGSAECNCPSHINTTPKEGGPLGLRR